MIAILLLGAVVLAFLAQIVYPPLTTMFILDPATVMQHPWTLLTSMFLHDPTNVFHIFFNGFALFMFGPYLERMLGSPRFAVVYFLSGIAGGLLYIATYYVHLMPMSIPALGASGAISGILGAVAILKPNLPVSVFFIPMTMRNAAIFWVVINLVFSVFDFGIAGAAHIGGLLVGAALAYVWLKMGSVEWADDGTYY